MRSRRSFQIFAWGVLLYHLAVILWGAFVRATGSGAGCGAHWPLCNGVAIPQSPTIATLIEFSHRITSGLALSLAIALLAWAFWIFPSRHLVRRAAVAVIMFELMEALIGAALVLLGQVAKDTSMGRGVTLSVHLINTLLLVGALTITAWGAPIGATERRTISPSLHWSFVLTGIAILLLGVSGAIAALGDTLFQSKSLIDGFRQDFAAQSHPFLKLRVWHPAIAAFVAVAVAALCSRVIVRKPTVRAVKLAYVTLGILAIQLGIGMVNLALLAPIPTQLIHLLFADLLWIAFVLLSAETLMATTTVIVPHAVPTVNALSHA